MTPHDQAKVIRSRYRKFFQDLPQKMRWARWRHIEGLVTLCRELPPGAVGIEIGSFAGESTAIFLECGVKRLLCVDHWATDTWRPPKILAAEATFDALCRRFKGRIEKRRGYSAPQLAALAAAGVQVDFAYIDADHSRDSVLADIAGARPLIKPGGILCGHDYGRTLHPGVSEAVDEVFGQPDKRFADSSWLKRLG